jgi:hypothetical protein
VKSPCGVASRLTSDASEEKVGAGVGGGVGMDGEVGDAVGGVGDGVGAGERTMSTLVVDCELPS